MLILPINGCARCGKDSFVQFIDDYLNHHKYEVINISTIKPVKSAMKKLGWNGQKTDENRSMMVEIKQLWIKKMNGPFNYVKNSVYKIIDRYRNSPIDIFFFIHVREPEEIQKLVDHYQDECQTILIRSNRGIALENGADNMVENYDYHHIIYNNGTLEDLKQESIKFAKKHLIQE